MILFTFNHTVHKTNSVYSRFLLTFSALAVYVVCSFGVYKFFPAVYKMYSDLPICAQLPIMIGWIIAFILLYVGFKYTYKIIETYYKFVDCPSPVETYNNPLQHTRQSIAQQINKTILHEDLRELEDTINYMMYNPNEQHVNILIHGPAGTGKTQTAILIAKHMGKKLVKLSLGSLLDHPEITLTLLEKIFNYAIKNQCILLIDDGELGLLNRDEMNENIQEKHEKTKAHKVQLIIYYILSMISERLCTVILTINDYGLKLDPGFIRRIDCVMSLQLPKAKLRNKIIKKHIKKSLYIPKNSFIHQSGRNIKFICEYSNLMEQIFNKNNYYIEQYIKNNKTIRQMNNETIINNAFQTYLSHENTNT